MGDDFLVFYQVFVLYYSVFATIVILFLLTTLKKYKDQAIIDNLTGLYNARFLHKRLAAEVERARDKGLLQVLFIDINDFKNINDNFGHKAGDEIMISLANVLKGKLRLTDVICRYGGDEFVILLPRTNKEKVGQILKRVIAEVDKLNITLSIGHYQYDSKNEKDPIKMADIAMYRAKERHRTGVVGSIIDTIA